MSLIYSETEAALLEAHRLASGLVERLQHAQQKLLDDNSIKALLGECGKKLTDLADHLEAMIRERDLLPRDPNREMEDLLELFDSVRSTLDDDATQTLLARFAEEHEEVLNELATLQSSDEVATAPLHNLIQAIEKNRQKLGGEGAN